MPKLLIVDGQWYVHRAYHALPPLTTSQGQPVNAVYGLLRMLLKMQRIEAPNHLAVCFDTAAPTFRHTQFAEYKATRKEIDENLVLQFPLAHEAVRALSMSLFEIDGYEADDLIAHLALEGKRQGMEVVIVSGDKDALQLVGDGVVVLNEPKNLRLDRDKVKETWGVYPEQLPDVLALMGDKVDNIPGVPGIGEVTAVKLIQQYGTLAKLLENVALIPGKNGQLLQTHAESARRSRELVLPHPNVPVPIHWESLRVRTPDAAQLTPFLQRMEFFGLLKEFQIEQPTSPGVAATPVPSIEALDALFGELSKEKDIALRFYLASDNPLSASITGLAVAGNTVTAYLPMCHNTLESGCCFSIQEIASGLTRLFEDRSRRLIGHDLKKTLIVLSRIGLHPPVLGTDTMLASYLLNPSRSTYELKDLALELLSHNIAHAEQLIGKGVKQISMSEVSVEQLTPFACAETATLLPLAKKLEEQIAAKDLSKLFHELELPLVEVLALMEKLGLRIDRPFLIQVGNQFREKLQFLETAIFSHAGESFNIGSPKQLSTILFDKLKLPVIKRTKTGYSTDEEVLQALSSKHPLPASLIEFREIQKLYSTYVEGLQASLSDGDDRIHTSLNQTVASTGRLSSSNPNLQNIPIRTELGRLIRRAFIPAEDHVFVSADYSQIDLRVLAHMTQDPTLVQAFRNNEDVHRITAAEVFGLPLKDVTAEQRRMAKSINFGIIYGMSPFGLSQQLKITSEEAKLYIERYFNRYAGVRTWIDKTLEEARQSGYVRTLFGRIRYLPEIQSKNSALRGFGERTAMNTPIQGTSADIIKVAMLQLHQAANRSEWKGHMLLQVHDDLLFEVPKEDAAATAYFVKERMQDAVPLSIPIVVDVKTGNNWADMTLLS